MWAITNIPLLSFFFVPAPFSFHPTLGHQGELCAILPIGPTLFRVLCLCCFPAKRKNIFLISFPANWITFPDVLFFLSLFQILPSSRNFLLIPKSGSGLSWRSPYGLYILSAPLWMWHSDLCPRLEHHMYLAYHFPQHIHIWLTCWAETLFSVSSYNPFGMYHTSP